jgi:hypothetical protein
MEVFGGVKNMMIEEIVYLLKILLGFGLEKNMMEMEMKLVFKII